MRRQRQSVSGLSRTSVRYSGVAARELSAVWSSWRVCELQNWSVGHRSRQIRPGAPISGAPPEDTSGTSQPSGAFDGGSRELSCSPRDKDVLALESCVFSPRRKVSFALERYTLLTLER